jgi:ABC-type bacteriocin/lantibiotic exporter with double-glycine peptidase domain
MSESASLGKHELSEFWRILSTEKAALVRYVFCLIFSAAVNLSYPLAIKDLYYLSETDATAEDMILVLLKWSLIFLIGAVASYYRKLTIDVTCTKLAIKMRYEFYKELLRKNARFFDLNNSADLAH